MSKESLWYAGMTGKAQSIISGMVTFQKNPKMRQFILERGKLWLKEYEEKLGKKVKK